MDKKFKLMTKEELFKRLKEAIIKNEEKKNINYK